MKLQKLLLCLMFAPLTMVSCNNDNIDDNSIKKEYRLMDGNLDNTVWKGSITYTSNGQRCDLGLTFSATTPNVSGVEYPIGVSFGEHNFHGICQCVITDFYDSSLSYDEETSTLYTQCGNSVTFDGSLLDGEWVVVSGNDSKIELVRKAFTDKESRLSITKW